MAIPPPRPTAAECRINASTSSIATTPVSGFAVVPAAGYVTRVVAAPGGTTSGASVTVAVKINGGSDICNSGFTVPVGSGARNGTVFEIALNGAGSTSGVFVNEGDFVEFAPSGATGASIPGAFCMVIRAI